ncbi:MAG: GntR family transcriptional regulator [Clostridia bacterium]|nr:GntR family transcriptional regulator [Clostridia bacterium]
MAWSFTQDSPVYLQIAKRIITSVLSGEYEAGQQIPSVRQLALEAAVNPNTVQHAFSELENEGIIISKGTMGRYVTEDLEVIEKCRKKQAKMLVSGFLKQANLMALSKQDIISILEEEMK